LQSLQVRDRQIAKDALVPEWANEATFYDLQAVRRAHFILSQNYTMSSPFGRKRGFATGTLTQISGSPFSAEARLYLPLSIPQMGFCTLATKRLKSTDSQSIQVQVR
jgi:hypothetical protein